MRRASLLVVVATLMTVMMSAAAPMALAKQPENEARDALCKDGKFVDLGFENQGQCVSAVNQGFTPPPPPPDGPSCEDAFGGGFVCTFPGIAGEFFCPAFPTSGTQEGCTKILV